MKYEVEKINFEKNYLVAVWSKNCRKIFWIEEVELLDAPDTVLQAITHKDTEE